MTERELTAARFEDLGRLTAGIIHDINTPLATARSNNQVSRKMLDRVRDLLACPDPKLSDAVARLAELSNLAVVDDMALGRIQSLLKSIRSLSRAGSEDDRAPADLNALLQDTIRLGQCHFSKQIVLEKDLEPLPLVPCRIQEIGQVFLNLLMNASDATGQSGTIRLSSRHEAPFVHISIADSGPGIPPAIRDHLFREAVTTKPEGMGTGLGLLICREIIVDRHNGRIDVESNPGQGAVFHIWLPVNKESKEPQK